ncbi:CDP-diacylglycerol--serine O-phosphatidyltransferase [Candidatus Dependentiae bacterium]|nr:CDP-diacylglycerol--serine O-phosphatidyltransferase [Candidatus Dependentiae bacterium]
MIMKVKALTHSGKQRCKKSLFMVPYIFTYLNAICGFLSILKSLESDYKAAAYYILMGACFDAFDGRLARALGSTSCFGMELDSLCDAISFCLAPTVLIYCWVPFSIGFGGKLILGLYLCAGLARLAKFNTTSGKQEHAFSGLPTTLAAFFIASLVLADTWLSGHAFKVLLHKPVLFSLVGLIACLMVSSVPFYSFKRYRVSVQRDGLKYLSIVLTSALCLLKGYPLLFFSLSSYILASVIYWLWNLRTR